MFIMHKRKKTSRIGSLLFFIATCTQAGTMGFSTGPRDNLELSIEGGVNWYHVPDAHLVISAYETDIDKINSAQAKAAWKIGAGYHFFDDFLQDWHYLNRLLVELNFYQTWSTITGNVWQYESEEFNNYAFRSPVTSTRLMVDLKPQLFEWSNFSPYAIVGLGAAFNTLSYDENILAADIDPDSVLSLEKHTSAQVAADLGAGVRVAFTDYISATAEYIYAFLNHGSPAAGPTRGVLLASPPRFSLQSHNILIGISVTV